MTGAGIFRSPVASIASMAVVPLSGIAAVLLVRLRAQRRISVEGETRIGQLTAELARLHAAQADLERAKDAAEAANLAKTRYLVGVSHEIRAPLNAIYGYGQLLERAGAIDPAEAARVIRRSSEHLTNIVDGLLDISRIESGVMTLSRDVVPLPEFLDAIVAMFRVQAEAKGLRLD